MKILLCTTTFRDISNGPTKFANFLYQKCDGSNGLEVHVLSEDILGEGVRLYKCKVGFFKKVLPVAPVYRMIKYYFKSKKLTKAHQFDYVIYNNAIYGVIHAFCKPNVVGMINDYINQRNISKGLFLNYRYIRKSIFKYFEMMAITYSKLILTNSDFLTRELSNTYPGKRNKIFRLYKGVEIREKLQKNNFYWNAEDVKPIKILFVKNDFVTGGIQVLAESLTLMNLQFIVTIIGPDLKYADQIKSYFTSPNVTLNLEGRKSQNAVFEYMTKHHIFCVPSLQEALGVANLEALNVGIPVVSSDAGGIPEALDYGKCGFLSKTGKALSLSNALKECIYQKEARISKVINGFEYVKKFKADFIPENLIKILNGTV